MGTEAISSVQIGNRDANPQVFNDPEGTGAYPHVLLATAECTTGKTTGSTYRMLQLPSSAKISSLKFACDALSTSATVDLGVYDTVANGGAAVDSDRFASTVSCSSAVPFTEERFNALGIETVEQALWQLLGLSSDPEKFYDIVVTATATVTAGGTLSLQCAASY